MSDDLAEIRDAVWNPDFIVAPPAVRRQELSDQILFDQYKLYVDMTDRMSARRALTNSFFLTINLAAMGAVTSLAVKGPREWSALIPVVGLIILLSQCFVWFQTLRSYRMLNKAKYAVIEVLEDRLPARIYSKGEWGAYVRSGRRGKYLRLTTAEQMMPVIFSLGYVSAFLYLVSR